jgi:hypothetical protein
MNKKLFFILLLIVELAALDSRYSDYTTVHTVQDNKVFKIKYKKIFQLSSARNAQPAYQTQEGYTFDDGAKILIKFNTEPQNISVFEARYGLKFQKLMAIGYFVFTNESSYKPLELIEKILESESQIKEYDIATLIPNWKLNYTTR